MARTANEQPILSVRGLRVRYGHRTALENVDFDMPRGTSLAVVGPNGAGKSTLLQVVAGLLPIDAGRVTVHGHEPGIDICVAYVPQRGEVDWHFPVRVSDVVMMGRVGRIGLLRRPGAADRARVAEALATVRLETLADRQIGALSGGQQQRMFIARALAQQAELVLMDEPFAGLDTPSRAELLDVMARLRAEGVSLVVATHDLDVAARGVDLVLLLDRQTLAFGAPERVLDEENLARAYGRLPVTRHG